MGRLIAGKRDEVPKYFFKRSNGIVQKMERLDFCEILIAPEYEKESVKYNETYKFFNLQVEAKILEASNNNNKFIDYWRGHITVLPSEVKIKKKDKKEGIDISSKERAGHTVDGVDKVRIKNLLYPLKDLYIHGGWKNITDERLTFSCNNCNDNFLKIGDGNLIFGRKNGDLPNSSFKSHDWVMEKLKEVIDKIY
jgi:hypothetical protein